jgi:hypothetical protein
MWRASRCSSASLVAVLAIGQAQGADAPALASGRNWRISLERMECEAAGSVLALGTRIHYLGPKGPVEAPVVRLVDAAGKHHLPRSLVWDGGSRQLAELLSHGGLRNLQAENASEIRLKFEVGRAAGGLSLEFGDIKAFALTRKGSSARVCERLLEISQVEAPQARAAGSARPALRIYRGAYPCAAQGAGSRTIEAEYPPHLPRQALLFGRGYLPNARQIDLPMGAAPAQPYSYSGPDDLDAVEDAARKAVAADFPEHAARAKSFAFNWGAQRGQSGNQVYLVALYELRACAR